MKHSLTASSVVMTLCLFACTDSNKITGTDQVEKDSSVKRATVNQSVITDDELNLAIHRTLGKNAALYMTDELEQKLLQSLIASRAIAQKSESEMSVDEKNELRLKTAAFREELLVKQYLGRHVTPQPVSTEMVKKYYLGNQERFGGGTIKSFEYVQVILNEGADAALAVQPLNVLSKQKNWQSAAIDLKEKQSDWSVTYKTASLKSKLIQEPIKSMLINLNVGEVAPLKFEGNSYTLLKLKAEKALAVKPLSEVSAEIRKLLAPIQIKKAVKLISDKAIADAEIVRH